jgi:hypothetical protein
MASILQLNRNKAAIRRELLRRIGYTNGLHDIFRFARVVDYLHPIIPASTNALRAEIADRENKLSAGRRPALSANKYVLGIIDVARALGLLDKIAERISLSDRGYALYAIQRGHDADAARRAFLLMSVLDSDGEYLLNLLDLISDGVTATIDLGNNIMTRMLDIIDLKSEWARTGIRSSIAAGAIRGELSDARRVLEEALDPDRKILSKTRATTSEHRLSPPERVNRFLEHTVVPRREWLIDLALLRPDASGTQVLTEAGQRLLQFFYEAGCRAEKRDGHFYYLPLSNLLCGVLDAENMADASDLYWRAVCTSETGTAAMAEVDHREILNRISAIYPHVKLYGFNEAEISSVFHTLSCQEALEGRYFKEDDFESMLSDLTRYYPKEIFRLSKRRGIGGYIALRGGAQKTYA